MATNTIQKIGKYDVTEKLGEGGMGVVYKGVDPGIGRPVAIKMMTGGFADNPDLLKRFQREAQSAGTLQHPNIVIIYELGTHESNPYMAMEFIAGESLETIVSSRKRMSLVEKFGIMIQVLNGLNYAHQHGIVHRDIKPGNVMVLKDGTVKIVDFGIARISDNSMTKTGQIVGTINYMSPEQFNGHIVDGRSDIFSSGVLFYEFLTGELPFDAPETPSVILKILNEQPPPLTKYIQNYPPELEEVVAKALAKDREERYATAEDFAFDLGRIQEALKKEMVVEYVEQAKTALGKSELTKAKDLLLQVLKADTKYEPAKELMKQVQAQLSVQQRGEQIRQLRASAEEALASKMLDEAVSYADQALKLDKTNPELLQLHGLVMQAKARKDQVDKTLQKAQHMREDGDYDAALRATDDALALDPKATNAKELKEQLLAEVKKAQVQKEMTGLLDQARKEISARHFTAALELIRKSESLSPGLTQTGSLRTMISAAREQEVRRAAVDKLVNDLCVSWHRDTAVVAQQKTDDALKKYPGEQMLTSIAEQGKASRQAAGLGEVATVKELADDLMREEFFEPTVALIEHAVKAAPDESLKSLLAQARQRLDENTRKAAAVAAEADKLLKANKGDEAVALLEGQPSSYTRHSTYFEVMARCRAEQERLNGLEVQLLEARATMKKGDVTGAFNKAKSLLQSNPGSASLQEFIKEVEAKRAVVAKESVEKAIKDAKALLLARQSSAANRTLQTVATFLPLVPPDLQKAFQAVQKEVTSGGQQAINADMNKTIVHGSGGAASAGTAAAPAREAAQKTMVQDLRPPAKPFPTKAVAAGVLALALTVGGYFGYQKMTAPPPIETYVEINAVPWAQVKSIASADGKFKVDVNQETPVRVPLPSGEFTITFAKPDGTPATEKITVNKNQPGSVSPVFESVSANEIVQSSN
ncbi:MAG TPA: protein kinase [Terriglobales bacterium]|nr:protein kinase [Terriglobales bacterium]